MYKTKLRRSLVLLLLTSIMSCSWAKGAKEQAVVVETPAPEVSSSVIAVVNNESIDSAALDVEMENYRKAMTAQGQEVDIQDPALRKEALNSMVIRIVLMQEAAAQGIVSDEEAVKKQLSDIKASYPSEEEFKNLLDQQGITEAYILKQLTQSALINSLIDRFLEKEITVSEDDIMAFYNENPQYFEKGEQVHARHILVKADEEATAEQKAVAKTKIEGILKKVKDGMAFDEAAKDFSEGPSAPEGGDLGFFEKGAMVPAFEEAAFALEDGEISGIVESPFGYHIIKVEERKDASTASIDEVRTSISDYLLENKKNEAVDGYVTGLKEKASITYTEN